MSIVTSAIIEDTLHTPTRRELRYLFTDHVSRTHHIRKIVGGAAFDEVADLIVVAARLEDQLDEGELIRSEKRVMRGEDALSVVQNPIHSTDKKIAKYLIRKMMRAGKSDDPARREKAIFLAIVLKPLVDWMKANLTNAQIRNFLDITNPQLVAMNNRLHKVYLHHADLISFLDTFEDWE